MYVLGIDIGTTLTKVLVLTKSGEVVASGSKGYKLISKGSHIEQRAEDWTEAVVEATSEALRNIDGDKVQGISLSTQGASSVAMDKYDNTIGNALTWMDKRAMNEVAELEEKLSTEYIYATTGWKPNPT
ncbi:MAG: hypothetical protein GX783_04490, partial [Clostridiales bacterium]|nr:hypothetical protein [Clostridiales bacterium]